MPWNLRLLKAVNTPVLLKFDHLNLLRYDWVFLFSLARWTTPCPKAVPYAVASIPTANMFFTTEIKSPPFGFGTAYGPQLFSTSDISIKTAIKTAIINGLAGLQLLSAVSAPRGTGNCWFPSYGNITHSTLGIESMCVDISPLLIQTDNSTASPENRSKAFWWTNDTFLQGYPFISYPAEGQERDSRSLIVLEQTHIELTYNLPKEVRSPHKTKAPL